MTLKKFFAAALAFCMLFGVTGCTQSNGVSAETAEIKTIEPPENGWTLEDLLSVTYIYGNQITLPCTVENLGSNFALDTSDNLEFEDGTCSVFLNYKNMPISTINVDESKVTKINSNTEINKLVFSLSINDDNKDNIIINGVDFNCNREQAISKLGKSYEDLNEYSIAYFYSTDDDTTNRVLWLMFDENDNLVTIGILIND